MAKLNKKVIPISKSSIGLKCGDCLHFKQNAKFEKPCFDLGIKRFRDAPSCYSPNVYLLGKKNPDVLHQLGILLMNFSAQESRVFMSILKQANAFEKNYELKFGQPVMFCLGNDYLSNYFSGFAIGVAECGDGQVFIGSDLSGRQRGKPLTLSLLRDSVYTLSEFRKKKAQLEKQGRLTDPKPLYGEVKKDVKVGKEDYVPPSMDSAPAEWFDKDAAPKKSGRLKSKTAKSSLDGKLEFNVKRA